MSNAAPSETTSYLEVVAGRLRELLADELAGVYLGGSLALGGYDPARSDVDVAVVCRGPIPERTKREIVAGLRHEALPCPARGLELVVYPETTVRRATRDPGYELNLNTGRSMPSHVSYAPGGEQAEHWYAIDRAILREHGRALVGPPPARLFAALPREMIVGLLVDSIRWHEHARIARDDDAVLNACRALRYAAEGRWSSKQDAGAWARGRLPDGALAADALGVREGSGEGLEGTRVRRFLETARRSLEQAAGGAGPARRA